MRRRAWSEAEVAYLKAQQSYYEPGAANKELFVTPPAQEQLRAALPACSFGWPRVRPAHWALIYDSIRRQAE